MQNRFFNLEPNSRPALDLELPLPCMDGRLEPHMEHQNAFDLYESRYLMRRAARLVDAQRYAEADYVLAIVRTDAAEADLVPAGEEWLRPGQAAPKCWFVYQAALQWCSEHS